QPWLLINGGSSVSGTITNTMPAGPQIVVTINPSGLTPFGSPYNGVIILSVPTTPAGTSPVTNPNLTLLMNLTVSSLPCLLINPTAGVFNYIPGQNATAPGSLPFVVTTVGNDTIKITSSASWLNLTCSAAGTPISCAATTASSIVVTATVN